jgi:hypothetical protein
MDDQAQWRLSALTVRDEPVGSRIIRAGRPGIRIDAARKLHPAQAHLSDLLSIENREYHRIPPFPTKCHMPKQPSG